MEDSKIIELFFARNEEAIQQTDSTYGRRLYQMNQMALESIGITSSALPTMMTRFSPIRRSEALSG